jgi:hypothetical protein
MKEELRIMKERERKEELKRTKREKLGRMKEELRNKIMNWEDQTD